MLKNLIDSDIYTPNQARSSPSSLIMAFNRGRSLDVDTLFERLDLNECHSAFTYLLDEESMQRLETLAAEVRAQKAKAIAYSRSKLGIRSQLWAELSTFSEQAKFRDAAKEERVRQWDQKIAVFSQRRDRYAAEAYTAQISEERSSEIAASLSGCLSHAANAEIQSLYAKWASIEAFCEKNIYKYTQQGLEAFKADQYAALVQATADITARDYGPRYVPSKGKHAETKSVFNEQLEELIRYAEGCKRRDKDLALAGDPVRYMVWKEILKWLGAFPLKK